MNLNDGAHDDSPAYEAYLNELPPAGWSEDVMAHLSRFNIDRAGYVEQCAADLEGRVEPPWTVERLAAASACTLDPATKGKLLYLLAASRNPKALVAVGEGLGNPDPSVGFWAAAGLDNFWMECPPNAASDAKVFIEARKWWSKRRIELYAAEARE